MGSFRIITTTLTVVVAWSVPQALAEGGTNQPNQIVSEHKAFRIVKEAAACYIRQSDDTGRMALRFDGTTPTLVSLHGPGLEGRIEYWIDTTRKRVLSRPKSPGASTVALPTDTVARMKAGRILYVRVKPVGEPARTQEFSLMGFTAATRALSDRKCRADKTASPPATLEVELTRNTRGAAVVSGRTTLPDGMNLRISLHTDINGYYAQDTAHVHSGYFESAAFSDRGRALPPGRYTVSISSPLMYLQPLEVQRALGPSGQKIPEAIRERSSYDDSYTVGYSVSRKLD